MKKFIVILICIVLSIAMASCVYSEQPDVIPPKDTPDEELYNNPSNTIIEQNMDENVMIAAQSAVIEHSSNLKILSFAETTILEEDNYGRYLVEVNAEGQAPNRSIYDAKYLVIVSNVTDETYNYDRYYGVERILGSYDSVWLMGFKLSNKWDEPF